MKPTTLMLALSVAAATTALAAPLAPSAPARVAATDRDKVTSVTIKLKHLTPSVMARIIDPAGTTWTKGAAQPAKPEKKPAARSVFDPPEGIESITPNDAAGEFQVRGTPQGITSLRAILDLLDQPLRKVELEVLSVRLNKVDLAQLPVDFTTTSAPLAQNQAPTATFSVGSARGGYRRALQKSLDANRASSLLDVRATATNNITSTFISGERDGLPTLLPNCEVQLTPTINNDGTITVLAKNVVKLLENPVSNSVPNPDARLQAVANLRDGDTMAVVAPDADNESERVTVTFVTARIVR